MTLSVFDIVFYKRKSDEMYEIFKGNLLYFNEITKQLIHQWNKEYWSFLFCSYVKNMTHEERDLSGRWKNVC